MHNHDATSSLLALFALVLIFRLDDGKALRGDISASPISFAPTALYIDV